MLHLKIITYSLILALAIGCRSSPKNTKIPEEKQAFKQRENKPKPQQVALNKQEPNTNKEFAQVHGDIRRYCTLTYRHIIGYDTLTSQLSICKNVFTFFVENPDLPALKLFKDAGFPMEFWSTSMCAFYGVPVAHVPRYLKKAQDLGYQRVGYDATLITANDTTALVLSNMINVHFDRRTAQQDFHEVMNDIPGIRLEGGSLDYAFIISVTSNRLSDILARFNALKSHRLVKFVEFLPETCETML
ncbi:MAG: hypothetical protein ACKO4Y_08095 [Flavobacteriales bacterium]